MSETVGMQAYKILSGGAHYTLITSIGRVAIESVMNGTLVCLR